MNTNLAIEILKQATIETTVGACEKCPRKDKNKSCIGCLDKAKENVLVQLQQKENIIKEIYAKANDTNITSLDLRDYILKNLRGDK